MTGKTAAGPLVPLAFLLFSFPGPASGQTPKRLWVLRAPDEIVEYDPATFSPRNTVEVPPEVLDHPEWLSVSAGGRILFDTPMHGYGIVKESSDERGRSVLDLGTLYRIIGRMMEKGLLEDVTSDQDDPKKQRRYYMATELGRRVARAEAARLRELLESERGRLLWDKP